MMSCLLFPPINHPFPVFLLSYFIHLTPSFFFCPYFFTFQFIFLVLHYILLPPHSFLLSLLILSSTISSHLYHSTFSSIFPFLLLPRSFHPSILLFLSSAISFSSFHLLYPSNFSSIIPSLLLSTSFPCLTHPPFPTQAAGWNRLTPATTKVPAASTVPPSTPTGSSLCVETDGKDLTMASPTLTISGWLCSPCSSVLLWKAGQI